MQRFLQFLRALMLALLNCVEKPSPSLVVFIQTGPQFNTDRTKRGVRKGNPARIIHDHLTKIRRNTPQECRRQSQ